MRSVSSGLIYLPSSSRDLENPAITPYIARYVRGSHGIDHVDRIKTLKLLWDAIGTEFGGRHELYERNYGGNCDGVRLQALADAERTGRLNGMRRLVDRCLADFDLDGWTNPTWIDAETASKPATSGIAA